MKKQLIKVAFVAAIAVACGLNVFNAQNFESLSEVALANVEALAEKVNKAGKEYITIYYGADVKEKHAQKAADIFAEICPDADVNLLNGGQPVYYYMISAE